MRKTYKKLLTIFLALFLSVISAFFVSAEGDRSRLADMADLLSDSEEAALLNRLDEISKRQQINLVVVTVDSLEGKSAMQYADDFYDYNSYGFGYERDGILFLISMGERDWYISTAGYGITAFTDAGLEYMSGLFVDDLSEGNYAEAFTIFADLCDDYITQARTGKPYDVGNLPRKPFPFVISLAASLAVAFVISLIVTGIMRSQLKTVRSQSKADDYVKKGSMRLTKKNDLFLYRHVDRRERPKDNNSGRSHSSGGSHTHISSSGTRHGGRGGKF